MVVDPQAVFLEFHKTGILQDLQVLGNAGLGDLKGFPHLADAHGLVLKHLDDLDPVWIGESLHHLDKILHSPTHHIPFW